MKRTDTILDKIVADKRKYLAAQKKKRPQSQLEQELAGLDTAGGPDFYKALKADAPYPKIIAEAKKASPSAGKFRDDFSLEEINVAYQKADNVVAISVVTERDYFQGGENFLTYFASHNTHKKPLLRKDFLFEPYQILESKLLGAHAYLLIASLFEESELSELVDFGRDNGIEPLIEVHNQTELDMALKTEARCIGVNSRDLKTFEIDKSLHALLRDLEKEYVRIAESGIRTPEDLKQALSFTDAVLIGTDFMKAEDIAEAVKKYSVIAGLHL